MIDRVIAWSLRQKLVVLALAAALLVAGGWRASQMPVDVFPDLTAPVVTVIAESHGMAPEEVEYLVTLPIESALNGAAGVRRVRSSTGIGIAVVWVEFEDDADIYRARQVVAEKLQLARAALPPELPSPVLAPVSSVMGEIMFLALTSDRHSPMEVKTAADWVLRRRLLAVPGVSQVIPTGGETKQYQVLVKPERLVAYGVGLNEVVEALRRSNENASAGFYVAGAQEYLIHAEGRVRTVEDIGESLVTTHRGEPVLVRHLAEVRPGAAIKRGEGSHDAKPAVVLGVQKQPGANTLELTGRLDVALDGIQATLPEGMTIRRHVFRQATFIEAAVRNVKVALRDGALLVVLVVALFLASARATVVTLVALPLSLAVAVLILSGLGATLNTMSLGGMAIAVGELVDDAIVDVENVLRRLRENGRLVAAERRPVVEVVYEASREIRGSIVYATLIILLVFLPLLFLSGVEGRLLRPLAVAYGASLGASLLVALTVTPALCVLLLGRHGEKAHREVAAARWVTARYEPLLRRALPHGRPIAAFSALGLALAAASLALAGRAFLPDFNEGSLTISAVTLPGTSLEESDKIGRHVEEILLAQPEVAATARRTGRAELDEHAQEVSASEIDVSLRPGGRSKEALLEALRQAFRIVPGVNVVIGQPISHRIDHMLSGTRANVAVKVFGDDLVELRRAAQDVRRAMEGVPGVADLSVEQQADIPFLSVKLDRGAVARHGLRAADVAEAIEAAFAGVEVSRVRERQMSFDLTVRYDRGVLADLDAVRSTRVVTHSGAELPLHALAAIETTRAPNTISREGVQRKIVVMCNVAGRDLRGVVADVRRAIEASVKLPRGYHVEYGGQFERAEEATRTLLWLGLASIAGTFVLLFVALGTARDAWLVLVNLPLALVGGVAGVFLSGGVLSVASLVGFITLFGIATRNGLMLVLHVHHVVTVEGESDLTAAVVRASRERLVPVLMTALAAGLALVPLVLAAGEPGSEIQAPMAVVIVCGLLSSTALTMLVVPALYLRFGALRLAAPRR